MPRTKKRTTKPARKTEKSVVAPEPAAESAVLPTMAAAPTPTTPRSYSRFVFLIILVLALVGVFLTNRGWFLAAVVDGKPIFRWELNRVLTSRFGQQTLEGMISEMLIADAAKEANVQVTDAEVAAKQQEIVASLGGNVSVDDLLKYQGMSKVDFDNQVKLQLTVQKILGKDLAITEADIDAFIASNRAMLVATTPAGMRDEARQAILDQKIGERLQPWFEQLKQEAQVSRYL